MPQSLSSGLVLVLKYCSPFRLVCTLFSNSLVSFERFAPCVLKFSNCFWMGLRPFLKLSSLFRLAAFCFQILQSFSGGLLLVLKLCSLFRAARQEHRARKRLTVRKRLEILSTKSKSLRELHNKKHTAQKRLDILETKEQSARKDKGNRPLERD